MDEVEVARLLRRYGWTMHKRYVKGKLYIRAAKRLDGKWTGVHIGVITKVAMMDAEEVKRKLPDVAA